MNLPRALVVGCLLLVPRPLASQTPADPLEIGRILGARYPATPTMGYIPALAWSGSLRLAAHTDERRWLEKVMADLAPYLRGDTPVAAEPYRLTNLAGAAALFDASVMGDARGMTLAQHVADLLVEGTGGEPVRYTTGWTDDMYMVASLLGRLAAATEDPRYATPLVELLTTYAERLQRPDGLFVHAADGRVAWGRGNGFAALGLLEALTYLPDELPARDRLLVIFQRQMDALARHQTEDGSWRQVVDHPAGYRELTVTAMTVTAMARGVRLGWLDAARFRPIVARGWDAVVARIGDDGSVRGACASTAAGSTLQYYLERPVVNGFDDRAGGLALMAAMEMAALVRM